MLLQLTDWLIYSVFRMARETPFSNAVHFFIYDSIKIFLLLAFMIFVIGVIRSYLPAQTIRKWMSGKGTASYVMAAVFGAVTPFCSCSSIPIFFGFLSAGVPLGVAFAFLIASPLINEYLVVLMFGFFGWKIAVLYALSGLALGTFIGMLLGKLNLESNLEPDFSAQENNMSSAAFHSFGERLRFGANEAMAIIQKIWIWVLAGVGVGALIHNYVPQESIQQLMEKTGPFSVPLAVLLGVPMYGSCAAIVPVAVVLFQKGLPLGTALAFMMAITALSLPEAIMLRRAMNLKLIAIFFGLTALAMIFTGYVFNFLQPLIS